VNEPLIQRTWPKTTITRPTDPVPAVDWHHQIDWISIRRNLRPRVPFFVKDLETLERMVCHERKFNRFLD
jgi:hypothetical protein